MKRKCGMEGKGGREVKGGKDVNCQGGRGYKVQNLDLM
jgi:hypothetical protein